MLVSRTKLAENWLHVDVSRVNQLVRDGVFKPETHGRYDVSVCVPLYIKWLRNRTGDEAADARSSVAKATIRLKNAHAVKVELANSISKKEHLIKDEVIQYLEELTVIFTNQIDAFEGRLVGEIASVTGAEQGIIADSINKEVNATRTGIADALCAIANKYASSETDTSAAA